MHLHTMIDTVKSRGLTIEDWNIESHPIGKRYYKEFIIFTKVQDTLIRLSYSTSSKRYYVVMNGISTAYQTLDDAIDAITY